MGHSYKGSRTTPVPAASAPALPAGPVLTGDGSEQLNWTFDGADPYQWAITGYDTYPGPPDYTSLQDGGDRESDGNESDWYYTIQGVDIDLNATTQISNVYVLSP